MARGLQARKQELVRDAIYDAAIELFARKGFEETTIEEVALEAGVSRRSFFRYFPTKSDVLAHNIVKYGNALIATLAACPAGLSQLDTVRETASAGIRIAMEHPKTRQIMEISAGSLAAMQANRTGLVEVEIRLAQAFATRLKSSAKLDLKSRMLALLTLMVVDLTLTLWFTNGFKDGLATSQQVIAQLSHLLSDASPKAIAGDTKKSDRKTPAAVRRRR